MEYLNFNNMNGIPASFDLLRAVPSLFYENDSGKPVIEIPQVHAGHSTLEVHLSVLVESVVGLDLELTQRLRWHGSVFEWGVVAVAPWRPS